ncbi:MAG: hypothetical protein ABSE46_14070 [Terracidiphilus sp.]|jgi:hypothetical protein
MFTTTVPTSEVRPRFAELVVVSFDGTGADYVGVSQAGRQVVTGQKTIVVSNLIAIKHLSNDRILRRLAPKFAKRFDPPEIGAYRPGPALWANILEAIESSSSKQGSRVADLVNIVNGAKLPRGRIAGGLEVFERDAVASVLQAWGGPSFRKRVLREAHSSRQAPVATFLSKLHDVSVREDPQVVQDQASFPGMKMARRDVVGSVVLGNGSEYLTILNCNRQPLERTLGVDLIYYNHRFESFVLVQYKRMSESDRGAEYRPQNDKGHEKELDRMMKADKLLRAAPQGNKHHTDTFRLLERPFYVKLCEAKVKAALDAGMVSGMYVPLGLWRSLLKSRDVRGRRGGIVITWENCKRHLNNAEFTHLLRQGWIGSAAGNSEFLAQIIEEVLGSGRMLILARTSSGRESRDQRRDMEGRFAAGDDPAGAF